MGSKLAAVLAGVAAAGIAFAVLATGRSDTEPRRGEGPFPGVAARAVTELAIRTRGEEVRIVRADDAWRIAAPVDDAADPRRVEEALAALARIQLGAEPVATGREAWPRYEVGDDEVLTAFVTQKSGPLPALHMGRSGFARVGDDARVYEVPEFRRDVLERELTEWRDLAILDVGDAEVEAVEVIDAEGRRARADRAPGAERAEARSLPAAAWVLTAGEEYAEPFDPAVPAALVRYLLALRAEGVADGPAARDAVAEPALRIRLYSGSGIREFLLGSRVDTKTALGAADAERVWLLSHPQAQKLARGPRQWRHKRVLDTEPGEIVGFEVAHRGRRLRASREHRWTIEHPVDALIDARAADAYTRRFSPLMADAVAAPDSRLPAGAAELTFRLRDGGAVRVAVGERDDGTFVVASSERDDLLILHRQRAEKLIADAFALIRGEPDG